VTIFALTFTLDVRARIFLLMLQFLDLTYVRASVGEREREREREREKSFLFSIVESRESLQASKIIHSKQNI